MRTGEGGAAVLRAHQCRPAMAASGEIDARVSMARMGKTREVVHHARAGQRRRIRQRLAKNRTWNAFVLSLCTSAKTRSRAENEQIIPLGLRPSLHRLRGRLSHH